MLDSLIPGLTHDATMTVTPSHTVPAMGDLVGSTADMPPVLATAVMILFMEYTCLDTVAPHLEPHERTVGTRVDVTHVAATPVGDTVRCAAELVGVDGRALTFRVSLYDTRGLIGEGRHHRAVIDFEKFLARLA